MPPLHVYRETRLVETDFAAAPACAVERNVRGKPLGVGEIAPAERARHLAPHLARYVRPLVSAEVMRQCEALVALCADKSALFDWLVT